jgi:Na+-driven multidrug efflux pump
MVICVLLIASYVSLMLNLIAHTFLGDLLLQTILGVSPEVAQGAKKTLALLALLPFFTGFRGLFQGLVISARRTNLVSLATGVRVIALLGWLYIGQKWFHGPELGAFALLLCIVIETSLMGLFAWRCHMANLLPWHAAGADNEKSTPQILRFALPVAFSSGLQQTIPVVINAIISRLPDANLALAAFGVIRALLFMLAGPMRNLQQVYLTLIETAADYLVLLRFFWWTGCTMGLLTLAIAIPGNQLIFGNIFGLAPELRAYLVIPLSICAIYPVFYGGTNLLRAYFTAQHHTGVLGQATIVKFSYLLLCWLTSLLIPLRISGVTLAIFLLISSEIVEFCYLRAKRRKEY